MILPASRVAKLLEAGKSADAEDPMVVTPQPRILATDSGASVDLRLGTWFMSLREARMTHLSVDEPGGPSQLTREQYVRYGSYYVLHPGGFVLGATIEWIRMPRNVAAYVIGKSSWGRRGLIIATATGVHPGFKGCLTLELSNVGEIPIQISPGIQICQLFFHSVDASDEVVDQSQFIGRRRPVLGHIKADEIAKRLAAANKSPASP